MILGPEGGRRVKLLSEAATRAGLTDLHSVSYAAFAENPSALARLLTPQTWLRFESPDGDPGAFRALYIAGGMDAQRARYPVFRGARLEQMLATMGALGSPAQLALGLRNLLSRAKALAQEANAHLSADPEQVFLGYDKTACIAHLASKGIPVPKSIATPANFEVLRAALHHHRGRVFAKLRYGSGAAGTLALTAGPGDRLIAYTALEEQGGYLSATKTVRKMADEAKIAAIVDALIPLGLHVEGWVPKAGVDGKVSDLRMVCLPKRPPFSVLRLSRSPITNLHLDADRAPAERLWQHMDASAHQNMLETSAAVLAAFPDMQMLGLDIAVLNDYRRHVVLEVNAFGDHIRDVRIDGMTPQDVQLRHMQERMTNAN